MRKSANDTLDEASTLHGARASTRSVFLRWVFPREDLPALELSSLREAHAVIGRDESCDVVLPEHSEVSRRHATVRCDGSLISIEDTSSRNGTFVNGVRTTMSALVVGDVIRIGSWVAVLTSRAGPMACLAPGLFGGPLLVEALADARGAAASTLPVVIEGETGTGKEVVANAIHSWSEREGAFIAVNCAALPLGLAEAELFGYRRGAFTGADRPSLGCIRSAARGTLFLDEICELPLSVQAKLLRALERHEVQPLGEPKPFAVDFRIVAAAQESLQAAVHKGAFRGDLFARLATVTVRLPCLKERREDVPFLLEQLLQARAKRVIPFDARTVEALCLYEWPYNVRELARLVDYVSVLRGSEALLKVRHLPPHIRTLAERAAESRPQTSAQADVRTETEKLRSALRAASGNVKQAAKLLGVTRQRVYRMMSEAPDLQLAEFRNQSDV